MSIQLKGIESRPVLTITDRAYKPKQPDDLAGALCRIRPSSDWTSAEVETLRASLTAYGAASVVVLPIPTASHTPEGVVSDAHTLPDNSVRTIADELVSLVAEGIRGRVTELVNSVLGR